MTRENWTAMAENDILPDFVLYISDDQAPNNFLQDRYSQIQNISANSQENEVYFSIF